MILIVSYLKKRKTFNALLPDPLIMIDGEREKCIFGWL